MTHKFDHRDAYLDCPEALINWTKWKQVVRSCYGRSASAAEAVADWATIL